MVFDVKQAIIERLRATNRKNIEWVIDYMEKMGSSQLVVVDTISTLVD